MTMSQWVVDIILAIHLTRECFRWRCSCHQRLPQLNLNLYERILLGIHCTSSDTTMSVGYKIPTESLILNHSEPETIRGREVFDIFRGRRGFLKLLPSLPSCDLEPSTGLIPHIWHAKRECGGTPEAAFPWI